MYKEQWFTNTITSYAINPSKQNFNELTFVLLYINIIVYIHIVNQHKADTIIHVQCYDLTPRIRTSTNSSTVCDTASIICNR